MAPLENITSKRLTGFRLSLYRMMFTDFENIFLLIRFLKKCKEKHFLKKQRSLSFDE